MFVVLLSETRKEDIPTAGGKGANLGELVRAGLPVPPGFVIITTAYDAFVTHNEFGARLLELAAQPRPADPASYDVVSLQIRALFRAGVIPEVVTEEIQRAYAELSAQVAADAGGAGAAVAVRSSATAEDLPGASFAGQQDTYLNIHGTNALLEAVKDCWASLWTARAMAYRAHQRIDPAAVSLAVVVQHMVNAAASGILFTANPNTGRRDESMIDAAWGLGEAVVGGLVTPDQWLIDKSGGQVLSSRIADKATMTVRATHGVEEQPVPLAKRHSPAIDRATAVKLAKMGAQIEKHYAMPMDIEWAVADGRLYILQARPITALPEPSAEPPSKWPLPFAGGWFVRSGIIEQLPDPLSPLFGTVALPEMSKSTNALMHQIMGESFGDVVQFTLINGYVYVAMRLNADLWRLMVASARAIGPFFRGSLLWWWRDALRPRYVAAIAKWNASPPSALPAVELLAAARELTFHGTELYTGVQMVIPLAMTSELLLKGYFNALVRRPGDAPALTLLLGFDSQPIRADKALFDIAIWCRRQPALSALLAQTRAETAGTLLRQDAPPAGVDEEVWQAWRERFNDYLAEYGHSTYNFDFMYPVAADYPAPIFETFKFYLQGAGRDPYQRQQDAVKARARLTQTTLSRLDPVRAAGFRRLLAWAQRVAPVREDALADIGLGWPLLRKLLLELGRRLQAAGAITGSDDIFWLEDSEVADLAAALDAGQTQLDSHCAAVEERKMEWRGRKQATPPQMLPQSKAVDKLGFGALMPAASEEQKGPVIKGVGVGTGRVTATARVLHDPTDFAALNPGDVLVAAITTPAWTPLFALASAVVTDVGGPMSHGSIVAREYGIPAVLGTGVATRRIKNGQSIRVDGDAGTVTLLDEVTAVEAHPATEAKAGMRKKTLLIGAACAIVGLYLWWRRRRR